MVTFVDANEVREKRDLGHTFVIAGFRPVCRCWHVKREHDHETGSCLQWRSGLPCSCSGFNATTKGGLLAFALKPEKMPQPAEPVGFARRLFA